MLSWDLRHLALNSARCKCSSSASLLSQAAALQSSPAGAQEDAALLPRLRQRGCRGSSGTAEFLSSPTWPCSSPLLDWLTGRGSGHERNKAHCLQHSLRHAADPGPSCGHCSPLLTLRSELQAEEPWPGQLRHRLPRAEELGVSHAGLDQLTEQWEGSQHHRAA